MIDFKKNKKEDGFVILFAVLVSALILLMTVGILNIVKKQIILSSYSSESQYAFYAADAALECALYQDIGGESTQFIVDTSLYSASSVRCSGGGFTPELINGTTGVDAYTAPYVFRYKNYLADDDSIACAFVLLEKKGSIEAGIDTRITAVGFNRCENEYPDINDPSLLERRLSVKYFAAPPTVVE